MKGDRVPRNVHQETISHLTDGIALLHTLPPSPERGQQELAFHLALGAPLIAARGHSLAFALNWMAMLHLLRREPEAA